MSVDTKAGRYCDGCGRTIAKAHRIFEGKDYCSTCYANTFISKSCLQCGASARVHKHAQGDAQCRKCSLKGRVCQRCDRPIIGGAGMISAGKPVCSSCTPHFREARPCERCGRLSTRLSAVPQMGIKEKICDRCRSDVLHKTCSICRKSRKVAGYAPANKPYCVQCIPGQELNHLCPGKIGGTSDWREPNVRRLFIQETHQHSLSGNPFFKPTIIRTSRLPKREAAAPAVKHESIIAMKANRCLTTPATI